jgi:hypothetical protein
MKYGLPFSQRLSVNESVFNRMLKNYLAKTQKKQIPPGGAHSRAELQKR